MPSNFDLVEDALVDGLIASSAGHKLEVFPGDPAEKRPTANPSAWIVESESKWEILELGGGDGNQGETVLTTVAFHAAKTDKVGMRAARAAKLAVGEHLERFTDWCNANLDLGLDDGVIVAALDESARSTWSEGDWWMCEAVVKVAVECRKT